MEPWHSLYDTCFNTDNSNSPSQSPREQYSGNADNAGNAERDKKYLRITLISCILAVGAVAAFCIWNPYKQTPQEDNAPKEEKVNQERGSDKEGLKEKLRDTNEIKN